MSQAIHRVIKIHDRPRDQCLRLLDWFNESGTQRFDLHVRRYQKGISGTSETWITCHEDICAKQLIDFWPWLRRENANGADVYFRPHSRASHSIIFLDDVDLVKAHNFAKAYSSVVIQTSCNNAHVWVKTKTPLSLEQRYETQSALAKQGICDSGSTSGDHLGRLCGMFSQKRQCWVNLVLFSTPRAYDAPRQDSTSGQQGGGARVSNPPSKHSQSEAEFGWVIGMLKSGIDKAEACKRLEDQAKSRGKRSPRSYARMTTQKAAEIIKNLHQNDRL